MTRRKNIRAKVLAAKGHICAACGKPCPNDAEVDHSIPLALGGTDEADQCQVLCKGCHKRKTRGDITRIAKAKRIGRRQRLLGDRLAEKAGR